MPSVQKDLFREFFRVSGLLMAFSHKLHQTNAHWL